MVEMRRKSKPTPTAIQSPADPEEWIERANADGEAPVISDQAGLSRKRPKTKIQEQKPQNQETQITVPQTIPDQTASTSVSYRYISFAIDNITLNLFREMCFALDKGNVATLSHIIDSCASFEEMEFKAFPESRIVIGLTKRTMSFHLSQITIEKLSSLGKKRRQRNKSALCRYLIQFFAAKMDLELKLS